jgi:hypothetical protein
MTGRARPRSAAPHRNVRNWWMRFVIFFFLLLFFVAPKTLRRVQSGAAFRNAT